MKAGAALLHQTSGKVNVRTELVLIARNAIDPFVKETIDLAGKAQAAIPT